MKLFLLLISLAKSIICQIELFYTILDCLSDTNACDYMPEKIIFEDVNLVSIVALQNSICGLGKDGFMYEYYKDPEFEVMISKDISCFDFNGQVGHLTQDNKLKVNIDIVQSLGVILNIRCDIIECLIFSKAYKPLIMQSSNSKIVYYDELKGINLLDYKSRLIVTLDQNYVKIFDKSFSNPWTFKDWNIISAAVCYDGSIFVLRSDFEIYKKVSGKFEPTSIFAQLISCGETHLYYVSLENDLTQLYLQPPQRIIDSINLDKEYFCLENESGMNKIYIQSNKSNVMQLLPGLPGSCFSLLKDIHNKQLIVEVKLDLDSQNSNLSSYTYFNNLWIQKNVKTKDNCETISCIEYYIDNEKLVNYKLHNVGGIEAIKADYIAIDQSKPRYIKLLEEGAAFCELKNNKNTCKGFHNQGFRLIKFCTDGNIIALSNSNTLYSYEEVTDSWSVLLKTVSRFDCESIPNKIRYFKYPDDNVANLI